MALRWQDHSEPSEWVNYWAVWFTYTIENKPSLDNNLHFLSAWINAPQIAVFTVFAIRTPGQRCRAAHQYCSLGTEWLYRAGIPYPGVLLHSNSRVGWSRGESVSVTRPWDTRKPVRVRPRSQQLRCAAAMLFLPSTIGSWYNCKQSLPSVSVWLKVLMIWNMCPGGFGWLAALYSKREEEKC